MATQHIYLIRTGRLYRNFLKEKFCMPGSRKTELFIVKAGSIISEKSLMNSSKSMPYRRNQDGRAL